MYKTISSFCLAAIFVMMANATYAKGLDETAPLSISQGNLNEIVTLKDLLSKLKVHTIEINDPVYQKHKRYAGFWLSDVLNLADAHPSANSLLTFVALDGYKAGITQKDIIKSKAQAFVAIKDLDAPDNWEEIQDGKQLVSPGPFYLVWQNAKNSSLRLPWPYKIAQIVIADNDLNQKLFPDDKEQNQSIINGYKVFKQNCLACHSINLEGGVVGPELNVPRNILEYENRSFLEKFIANPDDFRARSKMPAFEKILPQESINDVLNYLSWMGKHKINP